MIWFRDTSDNFAVYIFCSLFLSSWEKSYFWLSFLLFRFFVCNVFLHSPSVTILGPFWSIYNYLVFGYHSKPPLWSLIPKKRIPIECCEANNIIILEQSRLKVDMSVSQRELKENTFKLPKAWETRATRSKIDFSFKSKWSRECHKFTGTIKKGK